MADASMKDKRQPSRLQRRAPASIQVTPVGHWNVAIPLLSPLVSSPDVKRSCIDSMNEECRRVVSTDNKIAPEVEKTPIVYKKWQHPAAPFYYESAPPLLHSICTVIVDRS